MLGVDVENPVELVQEIVGSGNRYGLDVMCWTLRSAPWIKDSSLDEKRRIFDLIAAAAPKFAGDMLRLSISDVGFYSAWIIAQEQFYTGDDFLGYLDDFIVIKTTEPRELFVILDAGYDGKLSNAGKYRLVQFIGKVTKDYVTSYLNNG
ncbi:hypothetical protein [Xylophilus sp. ASV27]|uniref:hypothetical protein n=1 Tax=Xylophilus sp. ASV27 TaxID=2795129 RepID=UPI0018EB867A|nr:hypothetical protein [Xylophilus sp. ASV27]